MVIGNRVIEKDEGSDYKGFDYKAFKEKKEKEAAERNVKVEDNKEE